MVDAKLKKFSAIVLLTAMFFVGNNVAHNLAHSVTGEEFLQLECDTCHVVKETLVSQVSEISLAFSSYTSCLTKSVCVILTPSFSSYLSRAPPTI